MQKITLALLALLLGNLYAKPHCGYTLRIGDDYAYPNALAKEFNDLATDTRITLEQYLYGLKYGDIREQNETIVAVGGKEYRAISISIFGEINGVKIRDNIITNGDGTGFILFTFYSMRIDNDTLEKERLVIANTFERMIKDGVCKPW